MLRAGIKECDDDGKIVLNNEHEGVQMIVMRKMSPPLPRELHSNMSPLSLSLPRGHTRAHTAFQFALAIPQTMPKVSD
ncbi:hypothetical protein VNO77_41123 [Canavalia gladiata]|uniref:Uncharacterized protein n=1 Tax=Canavalia gladiata TaxID=3824 RepID=A0AAN9JYN3_CANGL